VPRGPGGSRDLEGIVAKPAVPYADRRATTERRWLLAERRAAPYLVVLVFCSMVDWALTMDALAMGIAREGNPVMVGVLQMDPLASFGVKLGIPVLGGLFLYACRSDRYARAGIKLLACAYVALAVYQIIGRLFVV
jgi:hypothetical protein